MLKNIAKTVLSVIILALLIAAGAFAIAKYVKNIFPQSILTDYQSSVKQDDKNRVIIIDPGHGGEDPGAIGINGTVEKTLNLSLSTKIKKLLEFDGYNVIMTREKDEMLYDVDKSGSRKAQDLRNRLDFQNKYPGSVFVSIHMNKFPLESCRGLQVYYSGNNEEGRQIAEIIRKNVNAYLQPDNNREIKKADSSIFILDNITIPAVLVECGFISNASEAELLNDEIYQSKLARIISLSVEEQMTDKE